MEAADFDESTPEILSRAATSPPSPTTWATEPDISLHDVALEGVTDTLPASMSARREQYVLLTGGLGFIGSHTSVELLKAGYNVIIVDNLSNSYRSSLDGILTITRRYYEDQNCADSCPMVEMHEICYRDLAAMRSVFELHSFPSVAGDPIRSNIVGVIHLAAHKAVEESMRQPLRYYQNNVNGLVDLMNLLGVFNIKNFIFSSSAAVYGCPTDRDRPYREEDCIHPHERTNKAVGTAQLHQLDYANITNPYGRTKFFAEAILSDLVASDPSWNVVSLRYFNPVGCDPSGLLGDDPRGVPSNLLPIITQVMVGQRAGLKIYGNDWDTADGTAIRDFIHVSDLARGHTAALVACHNKRGYRTYNLGAGVGHSVLDVIRTMETVHGRPIPHEIVARRSGDVAVSVAAVDRARRELNWETKKTLLDACESIQHRMILNLYK